MLWSALQSVSAHSEALLLARASCLPSTRSAYFCGRRSSRSERIVLLAARPCGQLHARRMRRASRSGPPEAALCSANASSAAPVCPFSKRPVGGVRPSGMKMPLTRKTKKTQDVEGFKQFYHGTAVHFACQYCTTYSPKEDVSTGCCTVPTIGTVANLKPFRPLRG